MGDFINLEMLMFFATFPFFIIGLIGNVFVVRIVHKTREMHTKTNYLLVNLALSDAITILMSPIWFFSHQRRYLNDGFGKFACKFSSLINISITSSTITLTVLAVERYHALLKPFRTGLLLKEEYIRKAIALIWIASVLLCIPFFFFQEWNESHSTCTGAWTLHMDNKTKVSVIIHLVVSTYIPTAVMLYCYGSLINGLYFTNTVCQETNEGERSAEKKKLASTLMLAAAGFIIGYGPFAIFYTLLASGGDKPIGIELYSYISPVLSVLFNCSLCLNPILYAFRSTSFQKGFKHIIFCTGTTTTPDEILL